MKRNITLSIFLFLLLLNPLSGQSDSLATVINQEVWIPFMQSYTAFDAEAFMSVHTDDVIRVSHGKWAEILVGDSYAESMRTNAKRGKEQKRKRSIAFVFNERTYGDDHGWESGYYQITNQTPGQSEGKFNGEFTVVLKKVDGRWKILVDSDVGVKAEKVEKLFEGEGVLRL